MSLREIRLRVRVACIGSFSCLLELSIVCHFRFSISASLIGQDPFDMLLVAFLCSYFVVLRSTLIP